jgi:hypothetical protein
MIAARTAPTPAAFAYRICGLHLASSIELPSAAPSAGPAGPADVRIAAGRVPLSLGAAGYRGPNWEVSEADILLRIPSLARVRMQEGREVTYELAAEANESALPLFLTGSALGALLHQRGEYVLHASAVAVDGGAVVFCGQSGAGKSSLVAALCAAGFPLVSDDVCRIHFGRGEPVVIPDGRRLKLWRDTISHLGLAPLRRGQIRPGIDKYWVEAPTAAADEPMPLRAVYFLQPGDEVSLERQPLVNAVEKLRCFAYRPRLVRALGQESLWLNRSAVIAAHLPLLQLVRPWTLQRLPESLAVLRDHWSRL